MTAFAQLLRIYRLNAGLSRAALARAVGCDGSYCVRLEGGQRPPPRPVVLRCLIDALDLTPEEQHRFLMAAIDAPEAWQLVNDAIHAGTMRAANAILAACACDGCTAQRERTAVAS